MNDANAALARLMALEAVRHPDNTANAASPSQKLLELSWVTTLPDDKRATNGKPIRVQAQIEASFRLL